MALTAKQQQDKDEAPPIEATWFEFLLQSIRETPGPIAFIGGNEPIWARFTEMLRSAGVNSAISEHMCATPSLLVEGVHLIVFRQHAYDSADLLSKYFKDKSLLDVLLWMSYDSALIRSAGQTHTWYVEEIRKPQQKLAKMSNVDLCAWLRKSAFGSFHPAKDAAERIEQLEAALREFESVYASLHKTSGSNYQASSDLACKFERAHRRATRALALGSGAANGL